MNAFKDYVFCWFMFSKGVMGGMRNGDRVDCNLQGNLNRLLT